MCRSTFSTTTIASSTTIPIANTSPKRVRLFIENPSAAITANVPIKDTGTAINGIIEARHVCKNRITTIVTRIIASRKVLITSWIEARIYSESSFITL